MRGLLRLLSLLSLRFARVLDLVAGFFVLLMMVAVSADGILRFGFNRPIGGVVEGSELLLVCIVYLAAAWTQAQKGHIGVDFLITDLPARSRGLVTLLTSLLALGLIGALTWVSGVRAWHSWEMKEASQGIIDFPRYPARIALAVGCFFLCLQLIADIVRAFRQFRGLPVAD